MARNEAPPFGRGETFFGTGGTPNANDGANLEGKTWVFEDLDFTQAGAKPARSNRDVTCMVVRNKTGSALLPKLIAKMKVDGSGKEFLGQVNGYATTVGDKGFPIDEFLPAAGVADNDLFWVVVAGPATVTSAASGTTTVAVAGYVIPATGGKVVAQDTTVILAPGIYNQIQGAIGRAITAVAAINTDFLIDVGFFL